MSDFVDFMDSIVDLQAGIDLEKTLLNTLYPFSPRVTLRTWSQTLLLSSRVRPSEMVAYPIRIGSAGHHGLHISAAIQSEQCCSSRWSVLELYKVESRTAAVHNGRVIRTSTRAADSQKTLSGGGT